jgi:hypothetical protein
MVGFARQIASSSTQVQQSIARGQLSPADDFPAPADVLTGCHQPVH